jgi:hypothetical protein
MTRPGRRLHRMLGCLVAFFATIAGVNWLANPYGVWRVELIDRAYLSSQPGERVLTPYRVRAVRPTTILLGSSRMLWGMPIEQGYRDGIFNASLSGASIDELAAVVQVALLNPRLQRLVWGLDFFSFDENWSGFRDSQTRARLEGDLGYLITETLLSTDALTASRKLLVRAAQGRERLPPTQTTLVPWQQEVIAAAFASSRHAGLARATDATIKSQLLNLWLPKYTNYRLSASQLARFRDTLLLAKTSGIDVTLFIGPMSALDLEAIRQTGQWGTFQRWKRELTTMAPYWDFSGYSRLTYADGVFEDVAHFTPAVGHLILRRLLGQDTTRCG